MSHIPEHEDETALDQWLTSQMSTMRADLAKVLDVEAGLRDVQAAAHVMSLNFNVAPPLDVEAGLRAVLPPTSAELAPLPAFDRGRPLHASAQALLRSATQVRLTARRELPLEELRRSGDAALALSLSIESSTQLRSDWVPIVDVIYRDCSWEADAEMAAYFNRAQKLAGRYKAVVMNVDAVLPEIDKEAPQKKPLQDWFYSVYSKEKFAPTSRTSDCAREVAKGIETDLIRVLIEAATRSLQRVQARRINTSRFAAGRSDADPIIMFDVGLSCAIDQLNRFRHLDSVGPENAMAGLTDFLLDLAEDMEDIETAGLNFTGADLRDADLDDINLDGIRWSTETTVWPRGWDDFVRLNSVQIDPVQRPDLYEVRFGQRVLTPME